MKTIKLFFLCLLMAISANVFSQNQWYFGDKAGLQFNSDGTTSGLSGNLMITGEGCSIGYNENGTLKFYTNGVKVYFLNSIGQHLEVDMQNEFLKGDTSSSQSSVIIPLDCKRYSIVTVKSFNGDGGSVSINGLYYSIINFNNPNQPVFEVKNRELQTINPNVVFSEKLTVFKKDNKMEYWLVAHDYNNSKDDDARTFYVFNINSSNLTVNSSPTPSLQRIGGNHSVQEFPNYQVNFASAIGQMKFSKKGDMLALSRYNNIDVFNFNQNSGLLSNHRNFQFNARNYGVEFSNLSKYVYFSFYLGENNLSGVRRINLANNLIEGNFEESIHDEYFGLQMGSDNKIYCVYDEKKDKIGENKVMWIGDTDNNDFQNIRYNNKGGVEIAGRSTLGLPNIIKNLQGCGSSSACEVKCCLPSSFSSKQMLLENRNTRIFSFQNNPLNATVTFDYIVRQDFVDLMNSHINTINIETRGYSCPEATFTPSFKVYRYNNTSNSIGQQQIEQVFATDRSQFTLLGTIHNFSRPNQIIAPLPTQVNHFIVEFETKWIGLGDCSSSIFIGTTIQGGGTKVNPNGGVKFPKN